MKTVIHSPLFIALVVISLCSFAENPNVSIQYSKPLNQQEITIQKTIKESSINDKKEFCGFQFDSLSQSWEHYFKQTN